MGRRCDEDWWQVDLNIIWMFTGLFFTYKFTFLMFDIASSAEILGVPLNTVTEMYCRLLMDKYLISIIRDNAYSH